VISRLERVILASPLSLKDVERSIEAAEQERSARTKIVWIVEKPKGPGRRPRVENDGRQRLRLGKQHNASIFCKELHKSFFRNTFAKDNAPKIVGN
jgi:hypothetical protein